MKKLKEIIDIITENGISYKVTLCDGLSYNAEVRKLKIGNYIIRIKKQFENDRIALRILLKHELGHILYHHLDDIKYRYNKLIKFLKDRPDLDSQVNKFGRHQILSETLNIIHDFEVNTNLMTKIEEKISQETLGGMCVPEEFELPRHMKDEEYYEPIIKYLLSSDNDESLNNLRKLLELLSDITKSVKKSPKSDKDNSDNNDDEDGESLPMQVISKLIGDEEDSSDNQDDSESNDKSTGSGKLPGVSGSDKINWDKFKVIPNRKTTLFNYLRDYVFRYVMQRDKIDDPVFDIKKGRSMVYRHVKVPIKCKRKLRKYAIIVDISGSMDSLVVKEVLDCIVEMRNNNYISKESIIIYCNHAVQRVIKLTQEVKSPEVTGGTELHVALDYRYIPNDINDIVMVTDMGTNIRSIKSRLPLFPRSTFWGILYNCGKDDKYLNEIFKYFKIF